ncbi:MAG: hypothetical protein MUO82_11790 [Candidatus Thermoplasmatota archaeon]|nr:hypothetical protein [Candidatus Thermoplasmatota archaeon]
MIIEKKPEKKCYFCCFDNINDEGRVITENKNMNWYAFIPDRPEIFGHTIVTYRAYIKPNNFSHIQNIKCDNNNERNNIMEILNDGVITLVDALKKIKNVDLVYFAMLGETKETHMHYHLFPRYNIYGDKVKLNKWANKSDNTSLSNGDIQWINFFAKPTCGFTSFKGFQYFGEIEESQNKAEKCIGKKPSKELLKEITKNIKTIGGFK